MNSNPTQPADAAERRRQAEARLREQHPETGAGWNAADTERLVHELRVHQVELEMQNEELQSSRDKVEAAMEKYSDLYDFAPVGYLTLDREGAIREANLASASLLGIEQARLAQRRFGLYVSPPDRPVFSAFVTRTFETKAREACEVTLLNEGRPPVELRMEAVAAASGCECRVVLEDITERKRTEAERERLIRELQKALALVKSLSGLLPICASCKKIRDSQDHWVPLESYIQKHSQATFTHGLCPVCLPKYFPGVPATP